MQIRSLSALGIVAVVTVVEVLPACSSRSSGEDDTTGAVANSGLTELGAGTEIARCWFDVGTQSLSLSCSTSASDGKVFAPKVLQISGKHPDAILHQPISETIRIFPTPTNPIDGKLILQPNELPFDGRLEAVINLPDHAADDVVQAIDGRGAFVQPFTVASLDDARAHGAANPYVIKVPLETWQLRIALPEASNVALDVDPYHATVAPWQSGNADDHGSIAVKAHATGSGRCLIASIVAPKETDPLNAVLTGLASPVRGAVAGAGDYVADTVGGLRQATAEEAASGPCAAGSSGAPCKADGTCNSGTCVAGFCQDACGTADQACCGTSATAFGDRCGANAFCRTTTSMCMACGTERKVCCPDATGTPVTCSADLTCNNFGYCE